MIQLMEVRELNLTPSASPLEKRGILEFDSISLKILFSESQKG